jgi:PAS domain S-box-containing protein
VGFRGKQILTLTLVAGAVALVTSLVNAASLARIAMSETRARAELLADTLYHQLRRAIAERPGEDLGHVIATGALLQSYAEGVVGYAPTTLYVAITDSQGVALLHSDPLRRGKPMSPARSLAEFSGRSSLALLWSLVSGREVLETELPFTADGQRFGSVRVAVSTLLLQRELSGAIAANAMTAGLVVLIAFLASFYLANRLLAPLEMLRRELSRIDPGGDAPRLDLKNEADVGRVAEFFVAMSRRLSQDQRLREAGQTFMATMVSGLADAVLVVNRERQILSLNDPACRLLGRERGELQGRPLGEVAEGNLALLAMADEVLSRQAPARPRTVRLHAGGKEVLHSVSAHILRESEESVSGVMITARDLEKLSRLGAHLSYSQKLAALGKLTSGVAHEIKNPLNAMVIHVALLRQKLLGVKPGTASHLDVLEQEIRRLDRVIQSFLKFTTPEELHLDQVRLDELLAAVARLLHAEADARRVTIEVAADASLPAAWGDRELLQQAFLNLMMNACQAMSGGGRLRASAEPDDDGRLRVEFEDTGVGIPPSELPKIFDLYYSTRSGGTGIGLSMVYRIVQLHDGEISVTSTPGVGTRFTIILPEAIA